MITLHRVLAAATLALWLGACTTISETPGGGTTIDAGTLELPVADADVAGTPDAASWDVPLVEAGFLWPCEDNIDCNSGYCIGTPEGKQCSKSCIDGTSCPPGWGCSPIASAGRDTAFICVPIDTDLCRPCVTDSECNQPGAPAVGHCMDLGEFGSLCSRTCDTDLTCPAGFNCQPVQPKGPDGPTIDLCWPTAEDACQCTQRMVDTGAITTCYSNNDFGRCPGDLVCDEVGPFPACTAPGAVPEVCNGIDDDCDGVTDNNTSDCTVYYQDSDGDGYGLGDGECLCAKPDDTWVELGGDCNELVTSVNPGATESCNGIDDDCDGETDEIGADGCVESYLDNDGDGYGLDIPGVPTECRCDGAEGWAPNPGDCNDADTSINPGVEEVCNFIDDDCDSQTDEENADGCKPFFIDGDGDTYGLTANVKCLCGPTGAYIATLPGDCNDADQNVGPGIPEICDGIDNNCDNQTDEGGGEVLCPGIANGTAECLNGGCQLTGCETGWTDADGDPLNGCECNAGQFETPGSPGQSCSDVEQLGAVNDTGQFLEVSDNIAPVGDVDWYGFTAIDSADSGCDTFNVRVYFSANPGEQFAFDVYRKTLDDNQDVCALETCVEETEFGDYTNLLNGAGTAFTNQPFQVGDEERGECPCTNEPEGESTPGSKICTDNTAEYRVRVYRKPGFPDACASYTLRIENGILQ